MPSGRTIEFHNAFYNVPHIIDQLYALGIEPSPLNKDVYSRDFTINTLLFDPDNGEILDVTNKGVDDIKNKILRTPLPARKSIQINPKIILRGIRFKIAFNLKEDDDYATEAVKFAPNLIQFLNDNKNSKFIQNNVNKAMEINPDKAIEEFRKYGILEYLPINDNIDKAIKKEMFGTTITPSSFPSMKVAQTKMMQRLMLEREKHKAYMRRKRREEKEKSMEKFKILDRARSGYYIENPEPEFIKNRKIDKNRKLFDYITEQDY
jgi:tRNA nucleotidyltransferase/poly(A) polymerase